LKQIYRRYLRTPKIQNGFSIISIISFDVNIVAKHVNAKRMTIMAMGVLLH